MLYLLRGNGAQVLVRHNANDRVQRQQTYFSVGGEVKTGETVADCAMREIREERGVGLRLLTLRGVLSLRGSGQERES